MTDIEDLQKQIAAAQTKAGMDPQPVVEPEKPESRQGASAGITLVAAVMVCAFLGTAVDSWFDSKPWGLIIFLLLGIASGFYTVYKASKGS